MEAGGAAAAVAFRYMITDSELNMNKIGYD